MNTAEDTGFALPGVIFFIVIVSATIAAMTQLNVNQAISTGLNIESLRAYYAAQSGIEWAAYQVSSDSSWCDEGDLTLAGGLDGFSVKSSCITRRVFVEGEKTVIIYEIKAAASRGTYGVSSDYVYRQISTMMQIEIQ